QQQQQQQQQQHSTADFKRYHRRVYFEDRGLGTVHFVLQYIPGKAALYIASIKGRKSAPPMTPMDYPILISLKLEDDDRGKILIGLYYAPAKNELTVRIIQCVNLIAMDPKRIQRSFCQ
uniref:DUF1336 domain-containing protein n=1 Tax=Macrostomum lignano TaxID=282301 RepID=A0A1I8JQ69_9PLAT